MDDTTISRSDIVGVPDLSTKAITGSNTKFIQKSKKSFYMIVVFILSTK